MIELNLKVNINPFDVPDSVTEVIPAVQAPDTPTPQRSGQRTFFLHELDSDTLSRLCNSFTSAVFTKAGVPLAPAAVDWSKLPVGVDEPEKISFGIQRTVEKLETLTDGISTETDPNYINHDDLQKFIKYLYKEKNHPERIKKLAQQMTLPGTKCFAVSASEIHEVVDYLLGTK